MKNLLIIGFVWPEPDSTAAGTRMMQLIQFFQKNDWRITFVSTAAKTTKSFPLENIQIQTYAVKLNDSSFDKLLLKIKPDIVLFDRFLTEEQFGWRVKESCPESVRILDTEDLHFLRKARQEVFNSDSKISLKYLVNDITKREIASIYRCDLSLIISKFEYNLLIDTFKIERSILFYIPFLSDNLSLFDLQKYPDYKDRKGFMAIGNFKHKPNFTAVQYLKNTIWKKILKELPDAELYIYGAYLPDKVKQLQNEKEGFIIKGWAKTKEKAFTESRVCLAPLQFGAGLKGKLLEAMLYGTPSVTTSIGAEGMHDNMEWNGFIADDPDEFAKKAVELYNNETLWNTTQINGVEIINHHFSREIFENKFQALLSNIKENLQNHRLQNLTGEILMHHTLQSTKYLSKWIEEKNK
ncbi:MAG: glycosyltransferase [Bacteroidota bacterium]